VEAYIIRYASRARAHWTKNAGFSTSCSGFRKEALIRNVTIAGRARVGMPGT